MNEREQRLRVIDAGGSTGAADEEIVIETPAGLICIQQDDWQTAILRYAPGGDEPECVALYGEPPEEPPED